MELLTSLYLFNILFKEKTLKKALIILTQRKFLQSIILKNKAMQTIKFIKLPNIKLSLLGLNCKIRRGPKDNQISNFIHIFLIKIVQTWVCIVLSRKF